MEGALGPLLLSLLLLLQAGGCQEVKVVAAVGDTVQLQPKTQPSSWVAINWKVKLRSEHHWILRHDQNGTFLAPYQPFGDRVSFHPGNLSLQINSVMEKESGLYTMDLTLGDGSAITSNFRLFVLDRVQQPKIKASTTQERGRCYITLYCFVPRDAWVTYSWSRGVSSSPAPEDHQLPEDVPDLQFEITKSGSNTFYHCNVSNPVSSGVATIDVEPLCNSTVFCVALACKETEVAAATDENMLLVPENQWSVWEEITWRVKLSSRKLYSLVTLSSSDSVVDLNTASPLGRRIAFHPGNLSLQIELVNKSDSGVYSMDVTSASGSLDTTCFRVSVFDRVRQPNLTALSAHLQLGRCNVTLSCQVPAADRVTYSWSRGASSSPAREDQQLPGHQSQLQLEITAGSNDTFYHCNASNAASWGTATIDVKPLCIFPATDRDTASSTLQLAAESAVTVGIFLLLHSLI